MKIFWTNTAYEAEIRRRVFVIRQQTGANYDPERIDPAAVRVAIAAYHGVSLEAVREDSYFMKPMRQAIRAFGLFVMKDMVLWETDPRKFIPVSEPGVWPEGRARDAP